MSKNAYSSRPLNLWGYVRCVLAVLVYVAFVVLLVTCHPNRPHAHAAAASSARPTQPTFADSGTDLRPVPEESAPDGYPVPRPYDLVYRPTEAELARAGEASLPLPERLDF